MIISNYSLKLVSLLVLTSVFYISKVTSFSPVYYLQPIIATMLLAFIFKVNINTKISSKGQSEITLSLILILLVFFYFLLNVIALQGGASTLINLFVGLYSFVAITYLKTKSDFNKVINYIKTVITLVCLIFFIDSVYRVLNPKMPTAEAMLAVEGTSNYFYVFKFNTIMFADSNTVAIACLCFFCLLTYLTNRFTIKTKLLRFIFFMIILSTLSRAAILGALVFYFYSHKDINLLLKSYATLFGFAFVALILALFAEDGSLLSKLHILMTFFEYYQRADVLALLFGAGLDNSITVLGGIYSHIHFITALVEGGVLGFLLLILFLWVAVYITRMQALYIIIPNIIVGFSYFFYLGAPFIFVSIAVICFLERNYHHHTSNVRLNVT